jgi:hypothetical protein
MQDLLVQLQQGPPGPPGMKMGGPPIRTGFDSSEQPIGQQDRQAARRWPFGATLDHYAIPESYIETLKKGAANDVPVITGNNRDERYPIPIP